jgi:uncharacterized membrane protein
LIRYSVRDLGRGEVEPGGINANGGAVFTEVTDQAPSSMRSNIAGVAEPTGPIFHFPNVFETHPGDQGQHHFFATDSGGVNDAGMSVGTASLYAPNGGFAVSRGIRVTGVSLQQILNPATGFTSSLAIDVSDDGTVVGHSASPAGSAATMWRAGQILRIDDGLVNSVSSLVAAINNAGQVVGRHFKGTATNARMRAWLRNADGTTDDQIGPADADGGASDINDGGRVVGYTTDGRAWLRDPGHAASILPSLPGGGYTVAQGVNNAGDVVGWSSAVACLWSAEAHNSSVVDLNTVADLPLGVRLLRAMRINDGGLILCEGTGDTGLHVFLLTPREAKAGLSCPIDEGTLLGYDIRGRIVGIGFACRISGDIPQGGIAVPRICQLASFDCPGCLQLQTGQCGDWGFGFEGVPDGVGVTLHADGKKVAQARAVTKPRDGSKPFRSKAGNRALEIVFTPSGRHEYALVFQGPKSMKTSFVFPVRMSVFRVEAKVPGGKPKKVPGGAASAKSKKSAGASRTKSPRK